MKYTGKSWSRRHRRLRDLKNDAERSRRWAEDTEFSEYDQRRQRSLESQMRRDTTIALSVAGTIITACAITTGAVAYAHGASLFLTFCLAWCGMFTATVVLVLVAWLLVRML